MFPGLAVAEVLAAKGHEVLIFVSEKEVDARALRGHPGLDSEALPSIGLPPIFSPAVVSFTRRLMTSFRKCRDRYASARPHAVLGMGGFTSIAPLAAARWSGIPAYLHESNAIPGKANRLASRFCQEVFLGFQECAPHFGARRTRVTGTPIRAALAREAPPRGEARVRLGLEANKPTLLVMGGSQGATGINALAAQGASVLSGSGAQVVHLAGERGVTSVRNAYHAAGVPAVVLSFSDSMQDVYAAADLAISRSGAASLGELSWFGLPSILVPYPYAAEDHQRLNAEIFGRAGASEVRPERGAAGESLMGGARSLLESPATLARMSDAARALAPRDAAERVAAALEGAEQ